MFTVDMHCQKAVQACSEGRQRGNEDTVPSGMIHGNLMVNSSFCVVQNNCHLEKILLLKELRSLPEV